MRCFASSAQTCTGQRRIRSTQGGVTHNFAQQQAPVHVKLLIADVGMQRRFETRGEHREHEGFELGVRVHEERDVPAAERLRCTPRCCEALPPAAHSRKFSAGSVSVVGDKFSASSVWSVDGGRTDKTSQLALTGAWRRE